MRILMLAPQPFFRARGTPFSVLQRIQALTRLGHTVDLVTYPIGESVAISGLTIHRAARAPFVRDVPIGPSIAKILLDAALLLRAIPLLRRGGYDLLHTHEEAAIMGAWLSRRYGVPHLYDMHSSLPEQFGNFGRYDWWLVRALFRRLERFTLARADLVITVCPALETHITAEGYHRPHVMIENTYEPVRPRIEVRDALELRAALGLEGKAVVVYTGTLEPYQGIDLLLQAVPQVLASVPDSQFLIVGGSEEQAQAVRRLAAELGVSEAVSCIPTVPPQEIPLYHSLAAVLVTCRTRGVNTPLKIYEYLRAGRPIVATAIHSHTQVLDGSCAELVEPSASGVATGLIRVLTDPVHASSLAQVARSYSEQRYSSERYVARLAHLLSHVAATAEERQPPTEAVGSTERSGSGAAEGVDNVVARPAPALAYPLNHHQP